MGTKYKIIYYEGEPSNYGINKKGKVINIKTNSKWSAIIIY